MSSSSRSAKGLAPSETPQPGAGGRLVHGAIQPGAYLGIVVAVQRGQSLIGGIPERGDQLVVEVEAFEHQLVMGAVKQQPVRPGIVESMAERRVQAPGNLVDEVIHVVFETAVVIAGEDDPTLLV